MKGGDSTDQHSDPRDAEAEYISLCYSIDIISRSHSYDRHGADVSENYLDERIEGRRDSITAEWDQTWAATRFVSEDVHMMCRERCIAAHFDRMNTAQAIARGVYPATLSFGEAIGEGVTTSPFDKGNLATAEWVSDIDKATFVFSYDRESKQWVEITGFPDVR